MNDRTTHAKPGHGTCHDLCVSAVMEPRALPSGADALETLLLNNNWSVDTGLHLFNYGLGKFVEEMLALGAPTKISWWLVPSMEQLPKMLKKLKKFMRKKMPALLPHTHFTLIEQFEEDRRQWSRVSLYVLGEMLLVEHVAAGYISGESLVGYAEPILSREQREEYRQMLLASLPLDPEAL